ncbi:MAG: SAM-dependent methyltransferase [Nitrospinaceae bacterium]
MIETVTSVIVIGFFLILAGMVILPAFFGSPWHPLLPRTIRNILEFAEIKPGEKVYDLGSGDGRVLIAAAKNYGATGVGLEMDPLKVWISRRLARWSGVEGRVRIIRKNFYDFDYTDADVIYVYLTHQALDRLFPDKFRYLKPTVRIISYRFCLRRMTPTRMLPRNHLFLYRLDKGMAVDKFS